MRKYQPLLFLAIALLLLIGCGGDEEDPADEDVTGVVEQPVINYYPNTVGSTWTYRNDNGFEWGREVTGTRILANNMYHVFEYRPEIEDPAFDFLRTPSYRVTRNRVFFFVGPEIDQSVEELVSLVYRAQFADAGNVTVNVSARSSDELLFFRIPPTPGQKWEVINQKIKGNVILEDFGGLRLPFEFIRVITGFVVRKETVETPAGTFPDSFRVEYETKFTAIIEGEEETIRDELETIWLSPEVGMVKVEDEDGVTELIRFNVK